MRKNFGISIILLFIAFLSNASSEEFAAEPGQLVSPVLLELPSNIAGNSNASEKAITASIETAGELMGDANQGLEDMESLGLQPNSADSTSNLLNADAKSTMMEITLQLNAGNYRIIKDKEGYDAIEMDGFPIKYITGEPMLPSNNSKILLPPNVDYSSLRLEIVSETKHLLDGTYSIRPAPADLPQDQEPIIINETSSNMEKNSQVYSMDAAYPANYVQLLPYSQMRKWIFVPVEFIPFQYNPVQGTLTLIESVTVKVSYDLTDEVSAEESALLNDNVLDDLAPDMFINYNDMKTLYQDQILSSFASSATGRYVIITTNAIRSGSTKLNSFIAHKQSLGYPVSVITETDFGTLTGQSPNHKAEKIRQWLKNNYISLGIQYVLLIGNPSPYESGEGDLPMKMCYPRLGDSYQEAPTDAFYADLTGNWDINGNGYYGEWSDFTASGGVDFSPEVLIGRIPVYGTGYSILDSILQKTIDYETSTSTAWRKSALLPMSFSDSTPTDGAYLAEQMKSDYLSPNGYTSYRMYQKGSGACSINSAFSCEAELRGGTGVRDRWAANDYGIVTWWGHGSSTGAYVGYSGCDDGELMLSSYCSYLDNSHPSFTYQSSCTNGHPETSNNLQYSILQNGGIATVSATRVSWYSYGQTNFAMSTTNAGMGYEYVKRLVQKMAAANALILMKSSMTPTSNTRLMNYYGFNVYGDPSVSISNPSVQPTWTNLGGATISKHCAIMDNQGRRHVFVRGGDNALWDNVDGSWIKLGGILTSAPYASIDKKGKIHIVVRGGDLALWDFIFDTASWSGVWKGLGGSLNSLATAAMEPTYGNYMKIVARGNDYSLWLCDFNINDLSSYNWIKFGGYLDSWPHIMFDSNSRLHIFVAGSDSALWDNRGVLSSGTYNHKWHRLGGGIKGPVFSTLEPGWSSYLLAMVRGTGNTLWMADIRGSSDPETCNWIYFGGVLASEPFASTDTYNRVHTFIRGSDGAMWENVFSSSPWNPSGAKWIGHGGSISWSPWAILNGQTYAYVEGGDSAIWRKVYATSEPSSSDVEASAKKDTPVEPIILVDGATGASKA